MKNFDDFLILLQENPVSSKTVPEVQQYFKDRNSQITQHDVDLIECATIAHAVTMREILRLYHDWLQMPDKNQN